MGTDEGVPVGFGLGRRSGSAIVNGLARCPARLNEIQRRSALADADERATRPQLFTIKGIGVGGASGRWISQDIVSGHGSELAVATEAGGGASFATFEEETASR
ncbi:MAG: hypothetical protein FWD68_18605 [Alphaproteobacteria bacterium]|nr:hypothetical protein [Alphaproteobacteria bacterium]